jgi:hypothetical protein
MNKLLIPSCVLLVALCGCSDPKSKVIPTDMAKWDAELKPLVEKLSDEDKKLFAGYVARKKMGEVFGGGGLPEGTTVGQGIEDQKKWLGEQAAKEAEQLALKQKIERERAAITEAINAAVTVAVVGLSVRIGSFESGDYEDKQVIKLALENKSEKDIAGIKGRLKFINMFEKEVGSISFGYEDGIKAGQTASWTGERRYNKYIEEHKALANLQEGKYKAVFEPEAIVYADGKKLLMPK